MAVVDSVTLARLGEIGFLRRIAKLASGGAGVERGLGDDTAVVRAGRSRWLLTTDVLIEGVHFRRRWDRPENLGRRAFEVNASDIAAMGGRPRFALLSVAVPGRSRALELEELHRGFARAARRVGCSLVGGNLSAADCWMISPVLVGEATGPPLLRDGARAGHGLWVSGTLGDAARGRDLLLRGRRSAAKPGETRAFLRPVARLALGEWLSRGKLASAAIDVSDGLVRDLGHLCRASRVGAVVEAARIPLSSRLRSLDRAEALELALHGGEDYELLFTVPRSKEGRLRDAARRLRVRVTRIGEMVPGRKVRVEGGPSGPGGFDHYRA